MGNFDGLLTISGNLVSGMCKLTKQDSEEGNIRYLARALVSFLVKLLSFFRIFGCRQERRLENIHPSDTSVLTPDNHPSVESVKEDHVSPCLERLQRLELMFKELSSKPAEIPQEKEHALLDSWDRIKSIEFDLEKTKKVNFYFILNGFMCSKVSQTAYIKLEISAY